MHMLSGTVGVAQISRIGSRDAWVLLPLDRLSPSSTTTMKLTSLGLAVLAISTNVAGQYFSEGWKPGQAVTKSGTGYTYPTATPSGSVSAGPTPTANSKSPFDFSSILEVGPLKALFQKAGVNISEKLEAARQSVKIWDDRINLITDDNYRDLIVDEKFSSLEEERDRVWFLVMYASCHPFRYQV